MAFSNLFRRHSGSGEFHAASYACMDQNAIAETLLEELETQCRNASALSHQHKRSGELLNSSGGFLSSSNDIGSSLTKRHSSVDYSWLSPGTNLLQSTVDLYQLPDIIKMELSELINGVIPEDCATVVNQFRRQIRAGPSGMTPESIIALFRTTIANHVDQKQKTHSNNSGSTGGTGRRNSNSMNSINTTDNRATLGGLPRNNRITPKNRPEDEQNCIAELTEISIASSSNDGHDGTLQKPRSNSHV